MTAAPAIHLHVPVRTVFTALFVTLFAAGIELAGARKSGSLFLAADALHLVAHLGIFLVLLIPAATWHERGEDFVTNAVLMLVLLIALGIAWASVKELTVALHEPPRSSFMLLSLLGLGANLTTASLFRSPAKERWSFRAALAHELSDAALTVAGLLGALAIRLYGFRWVDPGLSFLIGLWLSFWSLRLLARRAFIGRVAWTRKAHCELTRPTSANVKHGIPSRISGKRIRKTAGGHGRSLPFLAALEQRGHAVMPEKPVLPSAQIARGYLV